MAASAEQIARLRRMVAEPTTATYTDDDLAAYIAAHPLMDANGRKQYVVQALGTTVPPTADPLWVPTYDLNAAAAEVWGEKAAALAANFDVNADGASMALSQKYAHACERARYYRARRAMRTITARPWPPESRETD